MTYTKKQHEEYLNELYSSMYGWTDVQDNFSHCYKTDKVANRYLMDYYNNHTLGMLQRMKDPIVFEVDYWDRKRKVER